MTTSLSTEVRPLEGIRVLVIFGAIPLYGQERANIEVLRAAGELGAEALFLTNRDWGHQLVQPALDKLGFRWRPAVFGPRIGSNIFRDICKIVVGIIGTSWAAFRAAREFRATHIHVMNWLYWMYALPFLVLTRTPVLYRVGDTPSTGTVFHRLLWRGIGAKATRIVCISSFILKRMSAATGRHDKFTVIYNYPPHREKVGLAPVSVTKPANALAITFVGQVSAEKGILVLIEAAFELIRRKEDVVIWIAGDYQWQNPLALQLIEKVERAGLSDRIVFLGHVENIPALLEASDIHVCPSICNEALGNVVLEAKAAGIPSVVFPDGGLPELVQHGVDGFVCREKSPTALVEGIEFFLPDRVRRESAGEAAWQSLQSKFNYERFQREWSEVFLSTRRKSS